jgi:Protein of unknown function (DUF2478)
MPGAMRVPGRNRQEPKEPMRFGYVTLSGRGRIDDLLVGVVAGLRDKGMVLAGTVRAAPPADGGHPCDMDVEILPDGPVHRISQSLGQGARGCRLDGSVIEAIAHEVEARLDGAVLLIVNKFGKQESLGRGLLPAIVTALDRGIPVLVGVNALNLASFLEFASGTAEAIQPDEASVEAWLMVTPVNMVETARQHAFVPACRLPRHRP